MNKETQDQMAAVMLLHGTPEQQREAVSHCAHKTANSYRCGHCGYEGPCYGQPTSAGVSAPWCVRCGMNNRLTLLTPNV